MRQDPSDGLPVVGSASSTELGVRPGFDITVDRAGNVVLDATGMSVAPRWRDLPPGRIPKRLRHLFPGASGSNNTACYALGAGPFRRGNVADGLELIPDQEPPPASHGVIAPVAVVPVDRYQSDLQNTRAVWQIDES